MELLQVTKAGMTGRFPRRNRWRHDQQQQCAGTLDNLRALLGEGSDGK